MEFCFDFDLDLDEVIVDLETDIGSKGIDLAWRPSLWDLFRSLKPMNPLMVIGKWGSERDQTRNGTSQRSLDSRGWAKGCGTIGKRKFSSVDRITGGGMKRGIVKAMIVLETEEGMIRNEHSSV